MAKTVFHHLDAICTNQRIDYYDTLDDVDKKKFSNFIINRGLSMNPSLISLVNEANKYWGQLKPRELYLFYSQIIPKGKQYNKWIKADKQGDDITLVKEYYGYSTRKAEGALRILTPEQIEMIKSKTYRGGK